MSSYGLTHNSGQDRENVGRGIKAASCRINSHVACRADMISEPHQAIHPGDGTIGASRTALRGARAWLLQAVRGIAMNCALGARLAEHGVSLRLWNLIGRGMIQLTAAQTTFGTMTTRADYDKRFAGPCRCQSAIPAVEVLTWSLV